MLQDLPGCSLSTLGQCWSLRYVTVSHCGLVCLDGLSQCRHLLYVNAEDNLLEYVDLKDLGSLQVARLARNNLGSVHGLEGCINLRWLDLSHNSITRIGVLGDATRPPWLLSVHLRAVLVIADNLLEYIDLKDLGSLQVARLARNNLGSVHGLEGCINLRWLDLSHNSITRIGTGLSPLRRLHTLDLSHNQLVGAQGLEVVVTCQRLLLDHNYLQAVHCLDKMCLLTELSLAGNNLLKVPELKNQVLIQTLNVNENSIKSLEGLACSWLPLLHTLSCEKNLLESCEGLDTLDSLEMLDVGFNQISGKR
ncbi:leucine-rich repeat and IQ domain-containing protein 1-like [Elysia marginata]|uniref:Leucine-rich repeat and IQ domain-containing protein 1-like n=1 Tax=Elysia marginata TaxID=1093978 RepID=A0AAV4JIJ7_9GAST|nr:leucine-rich repeat and IQ domain-containing protein 1-like [Elysia marginata]